jgi:hypothetical protein
VDVSARSFLRAPAGLACAHLRAGSGSGTFRYRYAPNFLELRTCEVRRMHHGRPAGSLKLHSWVTIISQQDSEA